MACRAAGCLSGVISCTNIMAGHCSPVLFPPVPHRQKNNAIYVRCYTGHFRAYLSHLGCSVTSCTQVDHGKSSCNTPRRKEDVLAFGSFIQLFVKVQSEAVG